MQQMVVQYVFCNLFPDRVVQVTVEMKSEAVSFPDVTLCNFRNLDFDVINAINKRLTIGQPAPEDDDPTATAQVPISVYSKHFLIIHASMASVGARAYDGDLGVEPPERGVLMLTRFLCLKLTYFQCICYAIVFLHNMTLLLFAG